MLGTAYLNPDELEPGRVRCAAPALARALGLHVSRCIRIDQPLCTQKAVAASLWLTVWAPDLCGQTLARTWTPARQAGCPDAVTAAHLCCVGPAADAAGARGPPAPGRGEGCAGLSVHAQRFPGATTLPAHM